MKIPENQAGLLTEFGYTEPEAQFLYVVATHSGYFTLRQFLTFTGAHRGKRSTQFARKVLTNGHASVRDYLGYGSIYHLFSRTLYGQIEKDNLRNRRKHSFEFIRTRLVLLDFVLANRNIDYFETEQDKLSYFCETLGVAKDSLPARIYEGGPGSRPTIRYFVDKFPLFLGSPSPSLPPVVTLSYVDSGVGSISSFLTHLSAYLPLLRQLSVFRFLYISPRETSFSKAGERFAAMVTRPLQNDVSSEVLRYFLVRRRFEKRQYVVPVTDDFEFLNEAKSRFHGERFERLYRSWVQGRLTENDLRRDFSQSSPHRTIFFETYFVCGQRSHLAANRPGEVNVA